MKVAVIELHIFKIRTAEIGVRGQADLIIIWNGLRKRELGEGRQGQNRRNQKRRRVSKIV